MGLAHLDNNEQWSGEPTAQGGTAQKPFSKIKTLSLLEKKIKKFKHLKCFKM